MWFKTTTGSNTQTKDPDNTERTTGPTPDPGAKDLQSVDNRYWPSLMSS